MIEKLEVNRIEAMRVAKAAADTKQGFVSRLFSPIVSHRSLSLFSAILFTDH